MTERHRLRDARRRNWGDAGNPYLDEVRGMPREIVDYEFATDPYANMLPGISTVRGMRLVADGAFGASRPGWTWTRIVALIMVILFVVVPIMMMFSSYLLPGQ